MTVILCKQIDFVYALAQGWVRLWFIAEPLLSTERKAQRKRRSEQVSESACSNSHTAFLFLTGCNHERLPSWKRGWHVQQLPGWRWAVGCDGVPGGRRADRHSDSHQVGWCSPHPCLRPSPRAEESRGGGPWLPVGGFVYLWLYTSVCIGAHA